MAKGTRGKGGSASKASAARKSARVKGRPKISVPALARLRRIRRPLS